MDNKIVRGRQNMVQFVKFGLVGVSNTLIDSAVYYWACLFVGMNYILASGIGFFASVVNAFYWSNRYIFAKGDGESRSAWVTFAKILMAYASTGLGLRIILLYVFVEFLGISRYLALLPVLIITVPLNFVLNKYWSFKPRKSDK